MLAQQLRAFIHRPLRVHTLRTRVRARMHGPFVFGHMGALRKRPVAHVAFVRPFVGVHAHVARQFAQAHERLQTHLTRVLCAQLAGRRERLQRMDS